MTPAASSGSAQCVNLKKLQLERLRWERPVRIEQIRIYRLRKPNGRLAYPPRWEVEFWPKPPPGALSWTVEGDEFVLTSNHPAVLLGNIKMVPGMSMRRAVNSLIRRRRRR